MSLHIKTRILKEAAKAHRALTSISLVPTMPQHCRQACR
jgi:hypothetical protein